jgi:hypothetical protein
MASRVNRTPKPVAWRNRIVGHDVVPAEDLLANPKNWRIHPQNQQQTLEGVLDEVGWVDEIKVNQRTGFVVDGHMRASMAIAKGETVPVAYLDLSDEEENLVLASFNPVAGMAVADEAVLNELIGSISTNNPDIAVFLDGLYSEVNQSALKNAQNEHGAGESGESGGGDAGQPSQATVRVLIQVPDVAILEQALIRTGFATRGEALIAICRSYLDGSSNVKRQLTKNANAKNATAV